MPTLKEAVERIFSADFLFDSANRNWHDMVAAEDGAPVDVDVSLVTAFTAVAASCSSAAPATMAAEISAAISDSTIVSATETTVEGTTRVMLRRKEALDYELDPERRTVFARPIHMDASEDEVKQFFATFGEVTKVDRRLYIDTAAHERPRPSCFITFSTEAAALKCVEEQPSYGAADSALAQRFIPKLQCMMKQAHDAQAAHEAEAQAAANHRRAQHAAPNATNAAGAGGAAGGAGAHQFLRAGCTCVVPAVPENITWQMIKARLGNLGLNHAQLKGKIGLVNVDNGKAYIVCKTPEAAQALLLTYGAIVGGADPTVPEKAVTDLKRTVPGLELLQGDDELEVQRKYPQWVGGKVQRKQVLNNKRARE